MTGESGGASEGGKEGTDRFVLGVEHFNAMEFWEAHEEWEVLWLAADTPLVGYYQGLIQLAAAYHHMKRGTFRGAARLFEAALRRLDGYPEEFLGLNRQVAVKAARRHLIEATEGRPIGSKDFPKLTFTES
jgi:predicted metal-dependent hydrolase